MLPDGVLSTTPQPAGFLPPRDAPPQPLVDYEMGGVAISDPSKGLLVKAWRMRWVEGDFILDAPATAPTVVYSADDVTELSFTFDQNMKPFITFVDAVSPKYYWYDSAAGGYQLVNLASDVITPKCTLDDKRLNQVGVSDIILAYIRAGSLCYRQQRDRFDTEYVLKDNVGGRLRRIGMNYNWRLQFDIGH